LKGSTDDTRPQYVIAPLTEDDLPAIAWSGSASHLRSVARYLKRPDEVDYLTVRTPDGQILAKGLIDFAHREDAGMIEQVAVHADVQGRGIGTFLLAEMEHRIADRGMTWAVLGVEDDNPRARTLYERLAYEAFDRLHDSWEAERENGELYMHETEVILMRKRVR
jgi:ribosomal protein S18 acetylase RimI-like enzyme